MRDCRACPCAWGRGSPGPHSGLASLAGYIQRRERGVGSGGDGVQAGDEAAVVDGKRYV